MISLFYTDKKLVRVGNVDSRNGEGKRKESNEKNENGGQYFFFFFFFSLKTRLHSFNDSSRVHITAYGVFLETLFHLINYLML